MLNLRKSQKKIMRNELNKTRITSMKNLCESKPNRWMECVLLWRKWWKLKLWWLVLFFPSKCTSMHFIHWFNSFAETRNEFNRSLKIIFKKIQVIKIELLKTKMKNLPAKRSRSENELFFIIEKQRKIHYQISSTNGDT